MTNDELKQDISRKWRLISDRLIGQYTYSAKSKKYIIKDIRKPNLKRVGYYPICHFKSNLPTAHGHVGEIPSQLGIYISRIMEREAASPSMML